MPVIFKTKLNDDVFKLMFMTTAAVFVIGSYVFWKQKNKKVKTSQEPVPKKWRQVGEVSSINLYPLKSGKHTILNSAECTKVGLKEDNVSGKHAFSDRSFVVFNEDTKGKITIKNFPRMLFIEVKANDEKTVVFSSPGADDLVVTLPTKNEIVDNTFVVLWMEEKVCTVDCGDAASEWFTKLLVIEQNIRCRLGYYARDVLPARRLQNGSWNKYAEVYKKMDDKYMGSYSDLASYMIMTQSSLDDLNSLLDEHVSERNFRPNIMVKNTRTPYEEDEWDWLKIGEDTVLRSFKLCTRCLITATNPETGLRHPDLEPLKTLKKYRVITNPEQQKLERDSPVLGMYMGLHKTGKIKIGDPVYVNDA